jgi:hypothetical protein
MCWSISRHFSGWFMGWRFSLLGFGATDCDPLIEFFDIVSGLNSLESKFLSTASSTSLSQAATRFSTAASLLVE